MEVKTYKHLFFDLDRTLWDFERNSRETLNDAFVQFDLGASAIPNFDAFINRYMEINESMWALYREGKINKEKLRSIRFENTLDSFGIRDSRLAEEIGQFYISESPVKTNLFPNTHKVLDYLESKGYSMHIITNGFEEVQHVKLKCSELSSYFGHIITSEKAGVKKPDPGIFNHALELANAEPGSCLMIGDDLPVDLIGAREVGMDQVYFNPKGEIHQENLSFEIKDLIELKNIL